MKYHPALKSIIIAALLFAAIVPTKAQYTDDTVFTFLRETYNRHDKNLLGFLIEEFSLYTESFPDSNYAADATFLLAKCYEQKGKIHNAIATYFKALFLYPNSVIHDECAETIRNIIMKQRIDKTKIEKMHLTLNTEFGGETAADRYYAYLKFLFELDYSHYYNLMLSEARRFTARFPDSPRLDVVLRWIGDIYATKNKPKEAAISYLRLDFTHPTSILLPVTRFSRGMILYKKLNRHEDAANIFSRIVSTYPESDFAGSAQFMLGEIKEKMKKDYIGAIAEYRKFVESYPRHEKVLIALFVMAELNIKKTKDYVAAINTYDEIVEKFQANYRGFDALKKAGSLYKDKIKNYSKAAEYYAKIAEIYPEHKKAPEMLIEAGSVCEKKLKNYQKAIDYYQLVLDKYPKHKKAKDANKKILKAKAKLTAGEK
jgi:TolA-binding protein